MALYEFKCPNCGTIDGIVTPIKDMPTEMQCEKCKTSMRRIYNFSVGNKGYARPLHSDSLAINPQQIPEHKKLFPNIDIDNEGRPIFHNVKEHDDYLNKTGFVKKSQRIRANGKNIHSTPAKKRAV